METVSKEDGEKFAITIELDEDVPSEDLILYNGCSVLYQGITCKCKDTWICIYRLRGG